MAGENGCPCRFAPGWEIVNAVAIRGYLSLIGTGGSSLNEYRIPGPAPSTTRPHPARERSPGGFAPPGRTECRRADDGGRRRGRILAVGRPCPCRLSVTSNNTDNIHCLLVFATGRQGLSSIVMAVMVSGCSTLERGRSARPSG